MEKQLWYTFYASIALGIFLGTIAAVGLTGVNERIITGALNNTITMLQVNPSQRLDFTIIAIIGVIGSAAVVIYEASKTFLNAGDHAIYVITCGLFGGTLLAFGRFGIVSLIGIIILVIGVILSYHREKEPPGSPPPPKR